MKSLHLDVLTLVVESIWYHFAHIDFLDALLCLTMYQRCVHINVSDLRLVVSSLVLLEVRGLGHLLLWNDICLIILLDDPLRIEITI